MANELKFTALQDNSSVTLNRVGSPVSLNLEYSTDGTTWTVFVVGQTYTLANQGDYIMLRAPQGSPNTSGCGQSAGAKHKFTMSGSIACTGNIMSLYDCNAETTTITDWGFSELFHDCTALVEGPGSTATSLGRGAYHQVFMGCTNLVSVGEIAPFTVTGIYAMGQTFSGCTALAEIQDEFDAGIGSSVYQSTFQQTFENCTSLTHAPSLKFKSGPYACQKAFQNCTSIVDAGDIICDGCSDYMFQFMYDGCSSLVTPPKFYDEDLTTHELRDAFTAASHSHGFLFRGCASMTSMPNFKITTYASKAEYTFEHLFDGCTSLVDASGWTPPSSYSSGAIGEFQNLFDGCTSLKKLPKFPAYATGQAQYGFQYAFRNCTSLERGADITVDYAHQYFFREMYKGCTNLKHSGVMKITGISSGTYNLRAFEGLYNGCSKLTAVCTPMNGTYIGNSYSSNWLSGVPATGTVYYTGGVLSMPSSRNASTIPSGWTIAKYVPLHFTEFFINGKEVAELWLNGKKVMLDYIAPQEPLTFTAT